MRFKITLILASLTEVCLICVTLVIEFDPLGQIGTKDEHHIFEDFPNLSKVATISKAGQIYFYEAFLV